VRGGFSFLIFTSIVDVRGGFLSLIFTSIVDVRGGFLFLIFTSIVDVRGGLDVNISIQEIVSLVVLSKLFFNNYITF
jgi:hypothetical protein